MTTIDKLAWILLQDRKVLFVRTRGKELFYNAGGKRKGEETNEQALMREIKEELSAELLPDTITYLETFSAQASGHPEGVMVEIKCYTADYSGVLTPSSEIEEMEWFTSSDMHRTTVTGQLILTYLVDNDYIN